MVKLSDVFRGREKTRKGRKIATQPTFLDENHTSSCNNQIPFGHSNGLHFTPQQLVAASGQSVGKQREHNEDSLIAFSFIIGSEGNNYPIGLYMIADGMGGHLNGEVASSTACRTMTGYILKKLHPTIIDSSQTLNVTLQELMSSAVNEAQRAVIQAAPGSGTTLTAVLVLGQQMTIGHVGDSRAYAVRSDGRVEALTRDHSLVKRLEELGQITSMEASTHPQRSVLYRALGRGEVMEADSFTTLFPQPGYLLLCSDGLWNVVPEEDFAKIINQSSNIAQSCHDLVEAANAAGGPDNISVILIQLLG